MARQRALQVGDRLLRLIGQEALAGAQLEQIGAVLGREPQGARVLRRGLAVGAGGRGALRGGNGVTADGRGVARSCGVVGEPRRVGAVGRGQRAGVQRAAHVRRERLLDRDPRELVPERDARPNRVEHAARQAFLELVEVARERVEQPEIHRPRDDRRGIERPARRGAQRRHAGEHGIADGRGQLDPARGERLGDEERVARGAPVQLGGVDAMRRRELGHRLRGQRREPDPLGRRLARELADGHAQRVGAVELVVAVAGDDEPGGQAAAEQAQHVERRLVGPVDVLDDQDRSGQLVEQRRGDRVSRPAGLDQPLQLAAGDGRDVAQRAERRLREQPFAVAPQDSSLRPPLTEPAQEGGLAHARLARQQHQPPAGSERGLQRCERSAALEELAVAARNGKGHGDILAASSVGPQPKLGGPPDDRARRAP